MAGQVKERIETGVRGWRLRVDRVSGVGTEEDKLEMRGVTCIRRYILVAGESEHIRQVNA